MCNFIFSDFHVFRPTICCIFASRQLRASRGLPFFLNCKMVTSGGHFDPPAGEVAPVAVISPAIVAHTTSDAWLVAGRMPATNPYF